MKLVQPDTYLLTSKRRKLNSLYYKRDKITHYKKPQVPRPKSQEPRPALKLRLEFVAWNLEIETYKMREFITFAV